MNARQLHGLYRATVINTADPMQRLRLQVSMPELGTVHPWALACISVQPPTMPAVGTLVWIMFEGGNADKPVWLGMLA